MRKKMFIQTALIASLAILFAGESVWAQPGQDGERGRRGGWGQSISLMLLGNKKVQEELELVDDQVKAIEKLGQEQRDSMRKLFLEIRGKMRDMDPSERQQAFEKIREKLRASNEAMQEKVMGELLPHQIKRLKQLAFQVEGRRTGGITRGRISPQVAEALNITDEQQEAMKKKAEQVQKDLEAKIARLRAQAETEILSVLSPEQQEKYKELKGDAFDFGSFDRGFRRGRSGGSQDGRGRGGRGRGPQNGSQGADSPKRPDKAKADF